MDDFVRLQGELGERFRQSAAESGKPRGLHWKSCELNEQVRFAEDAATGELVALSAATISFEAVEGGGMEDVEAVSNLRTATAVFNYRDGKWTTNGRTVFNLEPGEALDRFSDALIPVELGS